MRTRLYLLLSVAVLAAAILLVFRAPSCTRAAPNVASGAAWKMGRLADDWAALETEATLTDQMDQRQVHASGVKKLTRVLL
jgi:hypothetical protein